MESSILSIVEGGGATALLAVIGIVAFAWVYNKIRELERNDARQEKELQDGTARFDKMDAKIDGVKESIDRFSGKFDMYAQLVIKEPHDK